MSEPTELAGAAEAETQHAHRRDYSGAMTSWCGLVGGLVKSPTGWCVVRTPLRCPN